MNLNRVILHAQSVSPITVHSGKTTLPKHNKTSEMGFIMLTKNAPKGGFRALAKTNLASTL
jgi:hypothetical protein